MAHRARRIAAHRPALLRNAIAVDRGRPTREQRMLEDAESTIDFSMCPRRGHHHRDVLVEGLVSLSKRDSAA